MASIEQPLRTMSAADGHAARVERLRQNLESVIIGKPEIVENALVALLAGGHLLLEDVPGVGKTTLGRAMAHSLGCTFKRIQFTSDMLPSDVLGVNVFNEPTGAFEFVPGPIFAGVVLADEINRTTPRTQSALLEAMDERQVTIDNETHALPKPFIVVATQNPLEFHGTYPLPESQMDRFLLRVSMGYPAPESEMEIVRRGGMQRRVEELEAVASADEVAELQHEVMRVEVADSLMEYLMNLIWATRKSEQLDLGVSPRGSIALYKAAQARAFLAGREFAIPDDIKQSAIPVMCHRIVPRGTVEGDPTSRRAAIAVVAQILERVAVPE